MPPLLPTSVYMAMFKLDWEQTWNPEFEAGHSTFVAETHLRISPFSLASHSSPRARTLTQLREKASQLFSGSMCPYCVRIINACLFMYMYALYRSKRDGKREIDTQSYVNWTTHRTERCIRGQSWAKYFGHQIGCMNILCSWRRGCVSNHAQVPHGKLDAHILGSWLLFRPRKFLKTDPASKTGPS